MKPRFDRRVLQRCLDGLRAAMRWWLGEIAAVLRLGRGHAIDAIPRLRVSRDGIEIPDASGYPEGVHLVFESCLALRHRARFPAAVAGRLREAAALEIERSFPLLLAHLVWTAVDGGPAGNGYREADVIALRRADVESAEARLEGAGIPVVARSVATGDGGLLPLDGTGPELFGRRRLPRLLLSSAVLLLLAAAGTRFARTTAEASAAGRELATSEVALADILALRDAFDLRRKRQAALAAALARPQASAAIDTLARLLPDEAWLRELDLEGVSLTLAGYAPDPAALVAPLENSPLFAGVEIVSISAAGQNGHQDFRLQMRLADAAPGNLP